LYPFEAPFETVEADPEPFVSAIFSSLESEFLDMPKGPGFIEYAVFERGYETLKKTTQGFMAFDCEAVFQAIVETPIVFIVLRSMLGSPLPSGPTWPRSDVASELPRVRRARLIVRSA